MENAPLMYKNRPLVRSGNELYYGSPKDAYVVYMQIVSTKQELGAKVADKVQVCLLSNDPSLSPRARIVKSSEKNGLYAALDIGSIWLERALTEKKK